MKSTSLIRIGFFSALAAGIMSFPSHADPIVSVKLNTTPAANNYGNVNDGAGPLLSSDLAGMVAAANWNNVALSTSPNQALVDSTGASSGITLTTTTAGSQSADLFPPTFTTNAAGNNKLMASFFYNYGASSPLTLSFTSGTAFTGDVYVYARTGTVNALESLTLLSGSGASLGYAAQDIFDNDTDATNPYPTSSFVTDPTGLTPGNYVEFSNVTLGTSFEIQAQSQALSGATGPFTFIDGVQFVSAPAEVPEPSTYAMLGLGFGALLLQIRRRKLEL